MKEAKAEQRIRELEHTHRHLDQQLKTLNRRAYLTPTEQLRASELKKQKLHAKDELFSLRDDLKD